MQRQGLLVAQLLRGWVGRERGGAARGRHGTPAQASGLQPALPALPGLPALDQSSPPSSPGRAVMRQHFPCEHGCIIELGPDVPAYVADPSQTLFQYCLLTQVGAGLPGGVGGGGLAACMLCCAWGGASLQPHLPLIPVSPHPWRHSSENVHVHRQAHGDGTAVRVRASQRGQQAAAAARGGGGGRRRTGRRSSRQWRSSRAARRWRQVSSRAS